MQIFLICDVALDDKNAQNIHVIELFNNLSKVADVCLFVPKPKKIKFKFPNIKYVPWVFIPIIGLIFYHINLLFYLFFYCKKIRVDAIYVRQSEFSFVPLIISKYFGISYVVEINGLILDEMKMSGYSKLIISFAKMSEKNGYKHAIKIVAVTQGVKEGIMKLYNIPDEKIIVIGNGANIELFKPINEDEAKSELKLDQDVRYVCFVGNIVTWQGVGYLVLAAPSILLQCPNTRFLIVGDGSMKSECMHQAKELGINDKFIFTGSVPYEKVPLYINASDICVAPFIINRNMKIGLSPLKVFEYMACEKPIVSSEILNLEFIEQQNVGILVKPEDPEELAKAIIKLLKDEKLKEEMGKNGRKYVIKNHSWEANARKVADVCENLINKIVE
jgi:glycosyltransferase involved in cell wall biosynthesis